MLDLVWQSCVHEVDKLAEKNYSLLNPPVDKPKNSMGVGTNSSGE